MFDLFNAEDSIIGALFDSKVMELSEAPEKARSPIMVTFSGIVILLRRLQFSKARDLMLIKPLPSVTQAKLLQ
tara:strand:- start:416 stop:634 length:219 start_codon:yes stop_codon:yes gene_type:complete